MVRIIVLLVAALALLVLSSGVFVGEGTAQVAIGGRLALRARGRTVTLQSVTFRPNRSYFVVNVR